MRILIINQPYWPDVVATAQHMTDWAEALAARGHEVSVIASRSVYGASGGALPKYEVHNRVTIYRVGSNLFRKGRVLTRLIDFGLFHLRALSRALRLPRQDVVVCLTTPPFIGVVGSLLKRLRGSAYVQYEMDLYPDVPMALGVMNAQSLAGRLFLRIQRRLYARADRIVVLGRCMEEVLGKKGVASDKMVLVTPWADPEEIVPVAAEKNEFRAAHCKAACVVMYAGNLGLGHDTQTMKGAMEKLQGEKDIEFLFVGGGRRIDEIRRFVTEKSLTNVRILDYVPREALGELLSAADVHLITLAEGTAGLIVPSKLYGILAAGRPGIYIGPEASEIARTLREEDAGKVIAIGDVDGLVAAIQEVQIRPREKALAMQHRIREALQRQHTRDQCTAHLTRMVEELAQKKARA